MWYLYRNHGYHGGAYRPATLFYYCNMVFHLPL